MRLLLLRVLNFCVLLPVVVDCNRVDDFSVILIDRRRRAHRDDHHRISKLIAEVPSVQLPGVVVEADGCRRVEGIRERKFLLEQFIRVQIEGESNFGFSVGG